MRVLTFENQSFVINYRHLSFYYLSVNGSEEVMFCFAILLFCEFSLKTDMVPITLRLRKMNKLTSVIL